MQIDLTAHRRILESLTPKELAIEYTRILMVLPPSDRAAMINHILTNPRPAAADLTADLKEL